MSESQIFQCKKRVESVKHPQKRRMLKRMNGREKKAVKTEGRKREKKKEKTAIFQGGKSWLPAYLGLERERRGTRTGLGL